MSFASNLRVTATKADGKRLKCKYDMDAFTEKYYKGRNQHKNQNKISLINGRQQ